MKGYFRTTLFSSLAICLSLTGFSGTAAAADTCSRGLGEPPFLSFGVDSNLLMLIDNSGSMLDMAYLDPDLDPNGTADDDTMCFDESFLINTDPSNPKFGTIDTDVEYAGNFALRDEDGVPNWYIWVPGVDVLGQNYDWDHKAYNIGDIVYADGAFYRALTSGTSGGISFSQDGGVVWEPLLRPAWQTNHQYHARSYVFDLERAEVYATAAGGLSSGASVQADPLFSLVPRWQNGIVYVANTYVIGHDMRLYYTVNGGTSFGTKVTDDEGVAWIEQDFHAWQAGIQYYVGDIATENGMIFIAQTDHNSSGDSVYDDTFGTNWRRLDEGYYQAVTEAEARLFCRAAVGTGTEMEYHSSDDVCATVDKIILDNTVTPPIYFGKIAAFAASGNFLNWASASKFDIQKKLMTGGKYDARAQRLISENRGCAGSRFVKQVPLDQGTVDTSDDMTLTMSVRMSSDTDRADQVDDTARIEIYAITVNGMDFSACQAAIEAFQDPTGLGPAEHDVTDCLGMTVNGVGNVPVEHIIYHKAMQECWYWVKHNHTWKPGGDYLLTGRSCESMYTGGQAPPVINAYDPYYVCYGIYDAGPHDQREGFVGRCWEPGPPVPAGGTCNEQSCSRTCGQSVCYFQGPYTDPDTLVTSTEWLRCNSDNTVDWCSGNFNAVQLSCNKPWIDVWLDDITGAPCTPAVVPSIGYWSDNLDGNDAVTTPPEDDIDGVSALCIDKAMQDFCSQLEVPEVIDPSDQASSTEDLWNLPSNLIDSGIVGQLGGAPLLVMKGYIEQTTQPLGILHNTAQDLRIGAMAFNANGAGTECGLDQPPIDKFCPVINQDGASVITPIRLGSILEVDVNGNGTYDEGEDVRHVDYLVEDINKVRATSWTPLAEAMYNAIGYYTQNTQVRLYDTDFQTDEDVLAGWQPGHEYPQRAYLVDSGVLYRTTGGGWSSGASILDDSVDWNVVGNVGGWSDLTFYPARSVIRWTDPNTNREKLYINYQQGTTEAKPGSPAGAGPLYDAGVQWEPLIDPVANWCQDNHVLIITEGASTADVNPVVTDFIQGAAGSWNTVPIEDPGETTADDPAAQCTDGLQGSTYLDDLVYFAINRTDPTDQYSPPPFDLYPSDNDSIPGGDYPYALKAKKSITTQVVVAGALRDDNLADECNPVNLMQSAANNSGSLLLRGENPSQLEAALLAFFNDLRQRASAGSAASVISSARGGEGAIYQAIFWPELTREDANQDDLSVAWAGDVHGMFLDNRGFMFEDTNGDRTLLPYEDIDGDCTPSNPNYNPAKQISPTCCLPDVDEALGEDIDNDTYFDDVFEDIDGDHHLDVDEDVDGDNKLDCGEDLNCNGSFDGGEVDIDNDGVLDLTEDLNANGSFDLPQEDIDGDTRFDNVYEDVDRDGRLDENEDIDGDGRLDCGEDLNCNGIQEAGEDIDGKSTTFMLTEDLNENGVFDAFVDVDGDGRRDVAEDTNGNGCVDIVNRDRRVIIYFDENLNRSMGCYDTSIYSQGTCNTPVEMSDVNYLWSANEWLADLTDIDTETNRGTYISDEQARYIFTWNDLNNDGLVDDSTEIIPLETSIDWSSTGLGASVSGGRGPLVNDFDLSSDDEVDFLISWLRGKDWLTDEDPNGNGVVDIGEPGDVDGDGILRHAYRSRQLPETSGSATNITWRLGDVVHSTPMTVASPAEGYHLIYNDFSYAQFLRKHKRRRHMVYFGANDGMLHAVNAGYFSEKEKKFCLIPLDADGYCPETGTEAVPALGAEMWAYLPYNLQPHVKCLASPMYKHKYFVDQRPRIFDAKIFKEEDACRDAGGNPQFDNALCAHPNGWGTILVGGMRFGGTRIMATELNGVADNREFISSYFILDITNPEEPPELLGELTRNPSLGHVDLGYSSVIPAMVIMKKQGTTLTPEINKWYLAFGSGPHDEYPLTATNRAMKGISDVEARVGILPLDWLTDTPAYAGRTRMSIPDAQPAELGNRDAGTFYTGLSGNGFISDMITIDYDINPSYVDYKADALYFGSVQGDFVPDSSGYTVWSGGGLMYRLVTKKIVPGLGSPFGRGVTEDVTEPWQWEIKPLIDLRGDANTPPNQPITASASVGTDGYNFWIYFGTGRFFDADDKTDHTQQAYYGIKEPIIEVANVRYHTWDQVEISNSGTTPGDKGLLKVDEILVAESPRIYTAALSCRGGGTACLPTSVQADPNLDTLERYISGSGDCTVDPDNNCVDGWYKEFYPYANRERNVGQATLLGGLVTWTTYQPFNDVCQAEGNAYLYGVYYRTGTAWHQNIFGEYGVDNYGNVKDKLDLGRGLATTPNLHAGAGDGDDGEDGPKAFVQTSTGEIVEVEQGNLPIKNYKTGRSKWKEYIKP